MSVDGGSLGTNAGLPEVLQAVTLNGYSYEDRGRVLPAMLEALNQSGCWLEQKRNRSATEVELRFELQLRDADELYSELVAAGVEMTRQTHLALTGLCTLRRHEPALEARFRTVMVEMQMRFLEETELESAPLVCGTA